MVASLYLWCKFQHFNEIILQKQQSMQRLMTQVYYSKISLTGYNFFAVTRNLTLAIIGTLITYELVLFQM
ncbi:unnamed protein product [Arctia plantaginis]|uniref:Gustatory receptor n=1 Tax=Arctia plantaginis TaxID=874455 RepID=A0A8S0YRI2_ARCPL|nr:unnamed protein product [Arctia plantaginis]